MEQQKLSTYSSSNSGQIYKFLPRLNLKKALHKSFNRSKLRWIIYLTQLIAISSLDGTWMPQEHILDQNNEPHVIKGHFQV